MQILTYPHPSLRQRCTLALEPERTINLLEESLLDFESADYLGVGLSANQIGLTDRVCIIRHPGCYLDLVNPIIMEHGDKLLGSTEGCLSLPDIMHTIMRWERILVKTDNHDKLLAIEDFEIARIVQHEIDHLDGLCLLDRIKKVGRNDPCICGSGLKYKKCCIDK